MQEFARESLQCLDLTPQSFQEKQIQIALIMDELSMAHCYYAGLRRRDIFRDNLIVTMPYGYQRWSIRNAYRKKKQECILTQMIVHP